MRELGLWDAGEGIKLAFADVEALFPLCRFSDCAHETEPGCAVLAALEEGTLTPEKWKNYKAQIRESAFVTDHSVYLKQKKEFFKSLSRMNKARRKGENLETPEN
jgi:ribosome biogenesis GTPase